MRNHPSIGVQIPHILLPRPGVDLTRWAVIACDQFTSQPEYWEEVERLVGESPSTLRLVLPEVYLERPDVAARITRIHTTMQKYLKADLLTPFEGLLYVERQIGGRVRKGLMVALDLECYDYRRGSTSLVRATEGTIVERIPPRVRIRQNAPLELPHILVLIDDPQHTVIGPIEKQKASLPLGYDFELMKGSGHLTGSLVSSPALEAQAIQALEALASPQVFEAKYNVPPGTPPLLFAMGDGNHSLATAKAYWEQIKPTVSPDHPARYALVEIENVHDPSLEFEPIHRVLFGLKADPVEAMQAHFGDRMTFTPLPDPAAVIAQVNHLASQAHTFGLVSQPRCGLVRIENPPTNLPVGSLQSFLDGFMLAGGAEKIDYVHGAQVTLALGCQADNVGFYIPAMSKNDLFKTVILDGALPRKTFSLGEAAEKRFYLECRQIV